MDLPRLRRIRQGAVMSQEELAGEEWGGPGHRLQAETGRRERIPPPSASSPRVWR